MQELRLAETTLSMSPLSAATVMAVSEGYPGSYQKGKLITGLSPMPQNTICFQAGTVQSADGLLTAGGRVVAVTSLAQSLYHALGNCYQGITTIRYEGKTFRDDIGYEFIS
jgi:phosphoribosylamine-glycine ligase